MAEHEDLILDQEEPRKVKRWFESFWMFMLGVPMLAAGLLFKLQDWPLSRLLVLIGAVFTVLRATLIFMKQPRMIYEWLFFISQSAMASYLFMYVFSPKWQYGLKFPITVIFALGALSYIFKWPGNKVDIINPNRSEEEDQEEQF